MASISSCFVRTNFIRTARLKLVKNKNLEQFEPGKFKNKKWMTRTLKKQFFVMQSDFPSGYLTLYSSRAILKFTNLKISPINLPCSQNLPFWFQANYNLRSNFCCSGKEYFIEKKNKKKHFEDENNKIKGHWASSRFYWFL